MKQILILYSCYFESMSSGKRTSTRTQETVKVEATLSAPVSLSFGTPTQYRTRYCTQYTVQSAHADSSALANSITEASVLLAPDNTELVSGWCVKYARLRPSLARQTYWTGWRTAARAERFSIRGIYAPSARTKLQTNCTYRSAVCYSSTLLNNKHTWLRRLIESTENLWFDSTGGVYRQSILQLLLQVILNSFYIFKFNFNLPL